MEELNKAINTKIFESGKSWLILLIPMCIVFPLFIYLKIKTGYGILGLIGIFGFFIAPLVFIPKIKKICTRKVVITFNNDCFLIEIFHLTNGIKISRKEYFYNGLKWVRVISTTGKGSSITLKLINGGKAQYVFLDENGESGGVDNSSELLYKLIGKHTEKLNLNKVELRPSFLASQAGLICIFLTSILAAIAIGFHLYHSPRTFIVLLPALIILAGIISKRKKSLATYNKLRGNS